MPIMSDEADCAYSPARVFGVGAESAMQTILSRGGNVAEAGQAKPT